MMSFLQKVFPAWFERGPDRRRVARVGTVERRGPVPATASAAAPAAAADAAWGAWSVRRPLIAPSGDVAGYEFLIAAETMKRLRRRADQLACAAHVTAVLTSARLVSQAGRVGLARVPAAWLVLCSEVDPGQGSLVALEPLDPPAGRQPLLGEAVADNLAAPLLQALSQAVQALRMRGARVGWDLRAGVWTPLGGLPGLQPDFVWLPQGGAAAAPGPAGWQGLPLVASDMSDVEAIEQALQQGMAFVCGALTPRPGAQERKDFLPVAPEVRRIGQLLNQLVKGAETADIVSQIKGDVGLSYRLLTRIHSASFAQIHPHATIEQAVMLLGRNELYRWLSMLLVQFAGQRKTASALQQVTLWRARLLELLAIARAEEQPGQLFTLGLASMLGMLLQLSQNDVLDTLNLPEAARQALLHQTGAWYDYLKLAAEIEANVLGDVDALAAPFGGMAQVRALSDQAWDWAAQQSQPPGTL